MKLETADIYSEFDSYSNVDYRDNFSLGQIYNQFGDAEEEKSENRGFSIVVKRGYYETEAGILKQEAIKAFAFELKESGNFKYALKSAGIGWSLGRYYADVLNIAAEERGLPPIFTIKRADHCITRKLTAKQVSYIRYLVTKYPESKVASMYNINQSTVNQIARGLTWKYVKAAIDNPNKIISPLARFKEIELYAAQDIPTEETLRIRVEQNRWGIGHSICPFCKHTKSYYCAHRKRYKCANRDCYAKFTLLTGTVYEGTKLPLRIWYQVEKLNSVFRSGQQIALDLNISQKTVWRMVNQISHSPFKSLLLTDFDAPIGF